MALFSKLSESIKILKNTGTIKADMTPHPEEWYFSEAGHRAYGQAKTLAEKMRYFFDYLLAVSPQKQKPEFLQRIAFIMAHSMDHSDLPFAGYPNILDEKLNPFVALVKFPETGIPFYGVHNEDKYRDVDDLETAILLAKFHCKSDSKSDFYSKIKEYNLIRRKPYLNLDYPTDGVYTDIQKIERDIIWSRKQDPSITTRISPFCYDISTKIQR